VSLKCVTNWESKESTEFYTGRRDKTLNLLAFILSDTTKQFIYK
jgi:hypothetical protein